MPITSKCGSLLHADSQIYVASEIGSFPEDPDDRLIAITKHFGADTYLAGSGGKGYMDIDKYETNGIRVLFQDFRHPEYKQLYGAFEPFMSAVDLMFNYGKESLKMIRGVDG